MNEEQWLEELNQLLEEPAEEPRQIQKPHRTQQESRKTYQTSSHSRNQTRAKHRSHNGHTAKTVLLTLCVMLLVLAAVSVYILMTYHVVDFKLYEKDAQSLNLQEEDISIQHYEKLKALMPGCDIQWNVPFQGNVVSSDVTELTITRLSTQDMEALLYLEKLQTVHAEECSDYAQLVLLQQAMPQVDVRYNVLVSNIYYDQSRAAIEVDSITEEEIRLLSYLQGLKEVTICGNDTPSDFSQLRNYCLNTGIAFGIRLGETVIPYEADTVEAVGITEGEVHLLGYLKNLKKLHLVKPQASAETILNLQDRYPNAEISWEVEIAGQRYPHTETQIDLTNVVIDDLAEVENAVSYLADVETVTFGVCGIDQEKWGNSKSKLAASKIENEDMAAYRDRVREDYKVVWTVRLGPNIALRTDADNFMPNHFGVGQLPDSYAYNLRYCEDMVCLDVGHMTLTDISFVEFMPKLKYLILAWTEVQYIEPIRTCKNLVFLELDNSCIRDISPLVDCTALEDLNIGKTWPDVTPLTKMPWLKNVYMIFGSPGDAWKVSQALPDTRVITSGDATVGSGWRRLPNYYAMRDCLGVPYMN